MRRSACTPGGAITVESRRGKVSLFARADDGMPRGTIFLPFCYHEAAANLLTNPVLDPFGKIPEFKYCAVRVTAGGPGCTTASATTVPGRRVRGFRAGAAMIGRSPQLRLGSAEPDRAGADRMHYADTRR